MAISTDILKTLGDNETVKERDLTAPRAIPILTAGNRIERVPRATHKIAGWGHLRVWTSITVVKVLSVLTQLL